MAPLHTGAAFWPVFLLVKMATLSSHHCLVHGAEVAHRRASATRHFRPSLADAPEQEEAAATKAMIVKDFPVDDVLDDLSQEASYYLVPREIFTHLRTARHHAQKKRLRKYTASNSSRALLALGSVLLGLIVLAKSRRYIQANWRRRGGKDATAKFLQEPTSSSFFGTPASIIVTLLITSAVMIYLENVLPQLIMPKEVTNETLSNAAAPQAEAAHAQNKDVPVSRTAQDTHQAPEAPHTSLTRAQKTFKPTSSTVTGELTETAQIEKSPSVSVEQPSQEDRTPSGALPSSFPPDAQPAPVSQTAEPAGDVKQATDLRGPDAEEGILGSQAESRQGALNATVNPLRAVKLDNPAQRLQESLQNSTQKDTVIRNKSAEELNVRKLVVNVLDLVGFVLGVAALVIVGRRAMRKIRSRRLGVQRQPSYTLHTQRLSPE